MSEEITDDLSYSGIVNLIQGDTDVAADLLVEIATRKEKIDLAITKLEKDLGSLKNERGILKSGVSRVLHHLEKTTPLVVQRDKFIVVVTDVNISIERNVI